MYKYNIPTQSDVSNEYYRKSLDIERTSYDLCFKNLYDDKNIGMTINNFIYNDSKKVDSEFYSYLDLSKHISNIDLFKDNLISAKKKGYLVDEPIFDNFLVHFDGSESRKMKLRSLDENLVTIKKSIWYKCSESQQDLHGFHVYSYNPFELAVSEIDHYKNSLNGVGLSVNSPLSYVKSISSIVNLFSDNENVSVLEMNLFKSFQRPLDIEETVGTQANILKRENLYIAMNSDAHVSFDEQDFVINERSTYSGKRFHLSSNENHYKSAVLDALKKIYDVKKEVIINGKSFGKEFLDNFSLNSLLK